MWTAWVGTVAVAQLLLENGADTEARDKDMKTALMLAVEYGDEGMVRLLLEKGADIEAKNNFGNTALQIAVGSGHEIAIRLLNTPLEALNQV